MLSEDFLWIARLPGVELGRDKQGNLHRLQYLKGDKIQLIFFSTRK